MKGLSMATITAALIAARGDFFIAAAHLGVRGRDVNSYVRGNDELEALMLAINEVKNENKFDRISAEQFDNELERVTKSYKLEGLEVIHELATMDFGESAAMADVKLKAAIQLRGAADAKAAITDHSGVMEELNRLYTETAPRIKSVRALQIEFVG